LSERQTGLPEKRQFGFYYRLVSRIDNKPVVIKNGSIPKKSTLTFFIALAFFI